MRLSAAQVNARRETVRTVLRLGGLILIGLAIAQLGGGTATMFGSPYGLGYSVFQLLYGITYLILGIVAVAANRAVSRWAVPAQFTSQCPGCQYDVGEYLRCPECGLIQDGGSVGESTGALTPSSQPGLGPNRRLMHRATWGAVIVFVVSAGVLIVHVVLANGLYMGYSGSPFLALLCAAIVFACALANFLVLVKTLRDPTRPGRRTETPGIESQETPS